MSFQQLTFIYDPIPRISPINVERQAPGTVAVLDKDWSVGVQTETRQIVLWQGFVNSAGIELVPGEPLLELAGEHHAVVVVEAGEVGHTQPRGRHKMRGRGGWPGIYMTWDDMDQWHSFLCDEMADLLIFFWLYFVTLRAVPLRWLMLVEKAGLW